MFSDHDLWASGLTLCFNNLLLLGIEILNYAYEIGACNIICGKFLEKKNEKPKSISSLHS